MLCSGEKKYYYYDILCRELLQRELEVTYLVLFSL